MGEEKITIDDFIKIDLRIGKILHAEEVEDSRKMLKLNVDIGDDERVIYAGVKKSYSAEDLINKQVVVIERSNVLENVNSIGSGNKILLILHIHK